jgi:hypothetical protein
MKASPRMRASVWGFVFGASCVLLFAVIYSGPGLAEDLGLRTSALINGSVLIAMGLLWAAVVWVRYDDNVSAWKWIAHPAHVVVRSTDDAFSLRLTPDDVLCRRGDHVDTLRWDQIESVEVIAGGYVQGPFDGGALVRDYLFPITRAADQHPTVSLRFLVRGRAFPVPWPLTDGSRAVAEKDVGELRDLIDRLGQAGSRPKREDVVSEWASATVAEGEGTSPVDRRLE